MSNLANDISAAIERLKDDIGEQLGEIHSDADSKADMIESTLYDCIQDLKSAIRDKDFDFVEAVIAELEDLYKDI